MLYLLILKLLEYKKKFGIKFLHEFCEQSKFIIYIKKIRSNID